MLTDNDQQQQQQQTNYPVRILIGYINDYNYVINT